MKPDATSARIKSLRPNTQRTSQEFSLVDADARVEDRRRAADAVASAPAQLAEARGYLEKTYIRSPLDGVVLRKLRHTVRRGLRQPEIYRASRILG